VPKTLLAVDDSATMRKVLEITFGGEDFRVLTADGSQRALAHLSEEPVAVVIDTSLEGDDPYALAKEVRSRDAHVAIVLLASRYNPYDAARGKTAGADDSIDKPFDTQALIDKVKKAIASHEASAGAVSPTFAPAPLPAVPAAPPPPPVFQQPAVAQAPSIVAPFSSSPRPPVAAPPGARPGFTPQRSHTLSFEGGAAASPSPPVMSGVMSGAVSGGPPHSPVTRTAPSGVPVFQAPQQPPLARPAPASVPTTITPTRAAIASPTSPSAMSAPPAVPASPVAAAVNGQLAGKLGELGLTPAQVEAVLSLSREVVERVVWEVVPQLAETIIKEEISRLTRE
jgi:CheY-like chemotaxis protein